MLDLDTSTDTFTLFELDFDPEVPCFRADIHGEDSDVHAGSSAATHYMTITCQHCDAGSVVLPVCQSFYEAGMRFASIGAAWPHDPGCGEDNLFSESVEFTPIV